MPSPGPSSNLSGAQKVMNNVSFYPKTPPIPQRGRGGARGRGVPGRNRGGGPTRGRAGRGPLGLCYID